MEPGEFVSEKSTTVETVEGNTGYQCRGFAKRIRLSLPGDRTERCRSSYRGGKALVMGWDDTTDRANLEVRKLTLSRL
jgi:hypothetical protein